MIKFPSTKSKIIQLLTESFTFARGIQMAKIKIENIFEYKKEKIYFPYFLHAKFADDVLQ